MNTDLDAAVQQLRASGCENRFDARKLDPAQYPLTIEKPRYWELTGHVVEKTAKNIEKWGKTALSTQLHYMQLAFELVYEARIGDMARGLVKDTNKLLRKASNDWVCPKKYGFKFSSTNLIPQQRAVTYEKELANGHRITMVDTQATMDAHPEMSDEMLGAVMDLVEDYGSARSAGKSHYKTLQALQEYQNRLLVSCGLLQE